MKNLYYVILMAFVALWALCACASSRIATEVGTKIGENYQKAYDKGVPSAEQIAKAWPYVSGLIKGCLADDYEDQVSSTARKTITALDDLSKKETLTIEEKGSIIGYTVRLETLAGGEFWEKYGISLYGSIKSFVGGLM